MLTDVGPRFSRRQLSARYDVSNVTEDAWHSYSDQVTAKILKRYLSSLSNCPGNWVLNAGSGTTTLPLNLDYEVSLDLFPAPITGKPFPVSADILQLPFERELFAAAVCVGEVLAYCDPANAFAEFSRVLKRGGRLICDFGSTRSWRHLLRPTYGQAAIQLRTEYNEAPELTWVYDPGYIRHRLRRMGFAIRAAHSTHTWSGLARRLGLSTTLALELERALNPNHPDSGFGETITIVADLAEA